MVRFVRIVIFTITVVALAWVIRQVVSTGEEKKMDDLLQRIRMLGI